MIPLDYITELFASRRAHVGVIGLGYVGLPLLLRFSKSGFKAIGCDSDVKKIDQIKSGKSYINYIADSKIQKAQEAGMSVTSDYRVCAKCDVLIICLPTPLTEDRKPDLSYVINTVKELSPHLRSGQLISLESTTYPGTTEEEILPLISQSGLTVGRELFLVYSPEREDPANTDFDFSDIPKLVAGHTAVCLEAGISLYQTVVKNIVPMRSTKAAELTKLLENVQRSVNIGLMNEMKLVADKMDIDIFDVIDAASTKPFGFSTYYSGPGLGGHCIPIDPYYLTYKANLLGVDTRFIALSGDVNRAMPAYVINKLSLALDQQGKALPDCKVLIMGLSYKKNVGDPRESPAIEILDLLSQVGTEVSYTDPFFPVFPPMKRYSFSLASISLSPAAISSFDGILLITDHDSFDYDLVKQHAKLIVDTRGRYRKLSEKIIRG